VSWIAERGSFRLLLILQEALAGSELDRVDTTREFLCEGGVLLRLWTRLGGLAKQLEKHSGGSVCGEKRAGLQQYKFVRIRTEKCITLNRRHFEDAHTQGQSRRARDDVHVSMLNRRADS
jgi:hypothetical protein